MAPAPLMQCSFGGGGWISQEFVLLVVASVVGLLLAPVLLAAYVGWLRHRQQGAARAALRYGGAVLLAYAVGAGIVYLGLRYQQARERQTWDAREALQAPLRGAAPGTLSEVLSPSRWNALDTRARYDLASALLGRLIDGEPTWTPADWDAVAAYAEMLRSSLPAGGMSPHQADLLDGLRWFALLGPAAITEAEGRCQQRAGCLDALHEAAARHDERLYQQAQARMRQAAALDADTRAALERRLQRRRMQDSAYDNLSDLDLAWDRVQPGALALALQACAAGLPDTGDPSIYARICQEDLLGLLDTLGTARLCSDGRVLPADLQTLERWQQSMLAVPASGYQTRERLLAWTAALPARCAGSDVQAH